MDVWREAFIEKIAEDLFIEDKSTRSLFMRRSRSDGFSLPNSSFDNISWRRVVREGSRRERRTALRSSYRESEEAAL